MITTGLSNKIWMKILNLKNFVGIRPKHEEEAALKSQ